MGYQKKQMTHGEEWGRRKRELLIKIENLEVKLDLNEVEIICGLQKRMPHDEAARYYTEKLRRYWHEAGYCQRRPYPPLRWIRQWMEKVYWRGYEDGKNSS